MARLRLGRRESACPPAGRPRDQPRQGQSAALAAEVPAAQAKTLGSRGQAAI